MITQPMKPSVGVELAAKISVEVSVEVSVDTFVHGGA